LARILMQSRKAQIHSSVREPTCLLAFIVLKITALLLAIPVSL